MVQVVRVTVVPGCVGCRTVTVPASGTARELKERILAETGFPVSEQRLWRGEREVGRGLGGRAGPGRSVRAGGAGVRSDHAGGSMLGCPRKRVRGRRVLAGGAGPK